MNKVAVTGGAGFIGSHIVDYLMKNTGYEVIIVDDFSSGKEENIEWDIDVRRVNLLDREETMKVFKDIDIVIHCAAKIGGIGYFHKVPAHIISKNDAMNRNVFDSCVSNNIKRIIYLSSSMVFENTFSYPTREHYLSETPPPTSAYGFQKLSGEYYCKAYHNEHGLEYNIIRPFNAVGPREFPGETVGWAHVIPDLCKKIIIEKQNPVEILGDGKQIRCYTNVRDIAKGASLAVDSSEVNTDFNIGISDKLSVKELAKMIWNYSNRKGDISFEHKPSYKNDVRKRIPCSAKAREYLHWNPDYTVKESIKEYVEWFIDNYDT
jgi:UDP-glucose 4-epimerase